MSEAESNVCEHGRLRRKCPHCEIINLEKELQEQCRLNGMGAERELKLIAQVARLEKELAVEKDRANTLAATINCILALPNMTTEQLLELKDRCRAVISRREK